MNVLIPTCGTDIFFNNTHWAKNVTQVADKTMIQIVMENFFCINNTKYIVCLKDAECKKFHTDEVVRLIDAESRIIRINGDTGGALCTCLMAIEYIDTDEELIISNNDHKFDVDINSIITKFRREETQCGVVTFHSLHPRWSYVRLEDRCVVEAAEKRPISDEAIAGVYYYRHGKDFVEAAKKAIIKGGDNKGIFYISDSINEMILLGKSVKACHIEKELYHTFYEPKLIERYERELTR